MAEGRREQSWRQIATLAVTIGNSFRSEKDALKIENFPYCRNLKEKPRMATVAEKKAFADLWNSK